MQSPFQPNIFRPKPLRINAAGKLVDKFEPSSILAYLASAQGRQALASSMIAPLRKRLDYQGLARQVLSIEQLPTGAVPTYEKDIDVSSILQLENYKHDKFIITGHGKLVSRVDYYRSQRVILPKFEVYSSPTIRIDDVKKRRFNLIERGAVQHKKQICLPFAINMRGKLANKSRVYNLGKLADKMRREIQAEEDRRIFEALDAASKSGNNDI